MAQNRTLSITIQGNDMVYDSLRQLIYATIKSEDSYNFGNKVVAIDPLTGKITKSVFVGSQPMRMALTTQQTHLYVSLGGSPRIVRINLADFEVDMDFLTTHYTQPEFDYPHDDIAVFPNQPDYVVSTLSKEQGNFNSSYGVSILKKGKQLRVKSPNIGGWVDILADESRNVIGNIGFFISNVVVDGNVIVGIDSDDAVIMLRTPGDTIIPQVYYKRQNPMYVSGAFYARMAIDNHIIYNSTGKIARLTNNYQLEVIATLPNVNNPHRPFSFCVNENGAYYANTDGANITVKKFNKATYALEAEYTKTDVLPNATVIPHRFITLKDGKAALMVRNNDPILTDQYRIIIFNLDNNIAPNVNVNRESLSATERTCTVVSLPIAAEDMVFDSLRQRYYVAVKGTDPVHPNSILALNALTLAVEQKITLPEQANAPLILSKDAKYLYFQQIENHTISRFDIASWTVNATYDMGINPFAGQGRRYFLADGASFAMSATPIGLVIGDSYYSGGKPRLFLFDTTFNRVRQTPSEGYYIAASANGKRLFSLDGNTTARYIQSFSVNNQAHIWQNTYQKAVDGNSPQYKLFKDNIYSTNKLVTRVTDTVCFVDAYYPKIGGTERRSVMPTAQGIFLTELEVQGQPNVIIRNLDPKTLALREITRLNNLPHLNFGNNEVSQSVYDAVHKTLGFMVKQPYTNSPNFQNKAALFFARDFFTGNQEIVDNLNQDVFLSTYPNPFSNQLTIRIAGMESFENATLWIRDRVGRVLDRVSLSKTTLNQGIVEYQNDKLEVGFYFLTLATETQPLKTIKMVKF